MCNYTTREKPISSGFQHDIAEKIRLISAQHEVEQPPAAIEDVPGFRDSERGSD
jgi:hypothetical protein